MLAVRIFNQSSIALLFALSPHRNVSIHCQKFSPNRFQLPFSLSVCLSTFSIEFAAAALFSAAVQHFSHRLFLLFLSENARNFEPETFVSFDKAIPPFGVRTDGRASIAGSPDTRPLLPEQI